MPASKAQLPYRNHTPMPCVRCRVTERHGVFVGLGFR